MKNLVIFALTCVLPLIGTAGAKEVPPAPAPAPVVRPAPAPEVRPAPAPAAVGEDIRIGGEVRVRYINLSRFLFGAPHVVFDPDTGTLEPTGLENEAWVESRLRFLVEARLADGVVAVVRLSNDRAWGGITTLMDHVYGRLVLLDWAYLSMKNVAGHPVDLTIGRQPIELGDKMQIADDFDAIRLSFPLEPVVVDAFFAKIEDAEPMIMVMRPDSDLIGFHIVYLHPEPAISVNAGYYEHRARYFVGPGKRVRSIALGASGNVLGLLGGIPGVGGLGVGDIGLLVDGGLIFQTGNIGTAKLDANAHYFRIGAAMDLAKVSLRHVSLSGDKPATPLVDGDFQPMFGDIELGRFLYEFAKLDLGTDTNLRLWGLGIEAGVPIGRGVRVLLDYTNANRKRVPAGVSKKVGTELRLRAGTALTPDVTLGIEIAQFSPGAYWRSVSPLMTKSGRFMALQTELKF